ncbi:coproporphyrinogen III oxidase family protein [Campylobacter sp. faydin G-24]|uniref:Heme chaperone HemW n=1 Tax=Campylobacter anatolicus TaxID=2829105 RepID=A0ABS5HJH8_9BACT|nr:radical SAM family heme chaperone HemW [Campylobacter anatolicus]MBR8464406.1 coproporphyrinogen III oxidase family protein [Campylobacter anatolicus]MBR8464902.1 coproporphyrinogen III oxidase family protein [Campylobacter anatolicus]
MLLYIHIPFCQSKCPYCAFGSDIGQDSLAEAYFDALLTDLKFHINLLNPNKFKSVFIGGGTPSAVNAKFYEKIFTHISPLCTKATEISCEANPNSATLSWLTQIRDFGVNRISFGAQSFFADKLKLLGRIHNVEQIYKAVLNAKKAGFKNINVDLIYATKLDNKRRLREEVANLAKLKVTHASAYSLTLEENTPFQTRYELKNDSVVLAKFIMKELESIGLKQYEISNFGKTCKHNLGYWQRREYIGVGAYSVGFFNSQRHYAKDNLNSYIAEPTFRQVERLSNYDMKLEQIFMGLRSKVGVKAINLTEQQLKNAELLRKARKLKFKKGRYFANDFLLADEMALFLNG